MTEFSISRRQALGALAALGASALLPAAAQSGAYPSRPIELIVPFAAGGEGHDQLDGPAGIGTGLGGGRQQGACAKGSERAQGLAAGDGKFGHERSPLNRRTVSRAGCWRP